MTIREYLVAARENIDRILAQEDVHPLVRNLLEDGRKDLGGFTNGHTIKTATRTAPLARVKGDISVTEAVKQVLQASPVPLHVKEILARATALGAVTEAQDPVNSIDILCSKLQKRDGLPLERTGPRTWQWVKSVMVEA